MTMICRLGFSTNFITRVWKVDMNYQKEIPEEVRKILSDRNLNPFDFSYYAWPQVFSSTTGPRSGIGGQAMSAFTVEAYVCECGDGTHTVYLCHGMYVVQQGKFTPFERIHGWKNLAE